MEDSKKNTLKKTFGFIGGIVMRAVPLILTLIMFICSFFATIELDMHSGLTASTAMLKGIKIKQTAVQVIAAAFSSYDKEAYEGEMTALVEDIADIDFEQGGYYLTTRDKSKIAKVCSHYNMLKLAKSIGLDQADENGFEKPVQASYQLGIYAAAALANIIFSFAALGLLTADFVFYMLEKLSKGKKRTVFGRFGNLAVLFTMLSSALLIMNLASVMSACLAIILPLIFCPIILIAELLKNMIPKGRKAFLSKRFILQASAFIVTIIFVAVFVNAPVFTSTVARASGQTGRDYVLSSNPKDFADSLDINEDYTSDDVIDGVPNDLQSMTVSMRKLYSQFNMLYDNAYYDEYGNILDFSKAMSFIYLGFSIASLAFIGLMYYALLKDKKSILFTIPLWISVACVTVFIVGSAFIASSLNETFDFLKVGVNYESYIGAGPIAAFILAAVTGVLALLAPSDKKTENSADTAGTLPQPEPETVS